MKQVVDKNGAPVKGLFKKDDKSLVVLDREAFRRSQAQHAAIDTLNREVASLKDQMRQILEKLNGKH
jgi:uncharacterized protein YdcH (DUF465 family)